MIPSTKISDCQSNAGQAVVQVCKLSGVRPKIFYETLSTFLGNIDPQTVQAYSRKVPRKYIVSEDGYASFRLAILDTVKEVTTNHPWGDSGSKIAAENWREHGDTALAKLDAIHKEAFDADLYEGFEKIDDFLKEEE